MRDTAAATNVEAVEHAAAMLHSGDSSGSKAGSKRPSEAEIRAEKKRRVCATVRMAPSQSSLQLVCLVPRFLCWTPMPSLSAICFLLRGFRLGLSLFENFPHIHALT